MSRAVDKVCPTRALLLYLTFVLNSPLSAFYSLGSSGQVYDSSDVPVSSDFFPEFLLGLPVAVNAVFLDFSLCLILVSSIVSLHIKFVSSATSFVCQLVWILMH